MSGCRISFLMTTYNDMRLFDIILQNNGVCRDKYMDIINVTPDDRRRQASEMLRDDELIDLFECLGQNRLMDVLRNF